MVPVSRYIQLGYPFQHLALKYTKISVSTVTHRDANAVISSLELSDANYNVAWSILSDMTTSAFKLTSRIAIMDLLAMAKENSIDLRRILSAALRNICTPFRH